jgi:outer membrane lipoprotein SlyB
MKKGLVTIFCLLALTVSALPVGAQTRSRYYDGRRYEQRYQDYRYRNQVYGGRRNRWNRDRSFWDEHRDKLTTGIGAGGGALLGAAVGGKKGAVIGALLGAGGAALYTYKLRDRNRRYYRR